MEATLAAMRSTSLVGQLTPGGLPEGVNEDVLAKHEDFVQRSVRSMYVSGMFLDQPESARPHPGLQRCVMRTISDMESSVRDAQTILASLGDAQHARLRDELRKRPDFGMQVAEALDARAQEVGISKKRRMQIRAAALDVTTRMRRQNPATAVHEYLAKTEKIMERHGASALQRDIAARAGEQLFWAQVAQANDEPAVTSTGDSWDEPPRPSPDRSYAPAPAPLSAPAPAPAPLPPRQKPGTGALRAAALMFGIGAASGLAGILLVDAGVFVGVFVITMGVILLIAAIVAALVGLIVRLTSDDGAPG